MEQIWLNWNTSTHDCSKITPNPFPPVINSFYNFLKTYNM